jgi:hypothetical protein
MYTVKRVTITKALLDQGLDWMVVETDFAGVGRAVGYFYDRATAEAASEGLNDRAIVGLLP